jgi:hypothetical protein
MKVAPQAELLPLVSGKLAADAAAEPPPESIAHGPNPSFTRAAAYSAVLGAVADAIPCAATEETRTCTPGPLDTLLATALELAAAAGASVVQDTPPGVAAVPAGTPNTSSSLTAKPSHVEKGPVGGKLTYTAT